MFTPSKRKKKPAEEAPVAESEAPPTTLEEDETEADTAAAPVDDGLPHPRVYFPIPIPVSFPFPFPSPQSTLLTKCSASPSSPAVNSSSARPTSGRRPS